MINEALPFHDKAIGVPAWHQDDFERWITQKVIHSKKIEGFEIDKTPQDEELIRFAESAVREYVKKYGKDLTRRPDILLSQIHLMQPGGVERYTDGLLKTAAHASSIQNIISDRVESNIQFTLYLFHELMHLYSYVAVQTTKPDNELKAFRSGLEVVSRDGSKVFFKDWNEAVMGIMTERFFHEYIENNPSFAEDLSRQDDDFDLSRSKEKDELYALINQLYEHNSHIYKDPQEIEDLFIQAVINGRLLPVARLVEKTFGKGSFRTFGNEKSNKSNDEGE